MKNEKHLDDEYKDLIKGISFNPVFIMGLHRSGTSILYKILSNTNQFNILTAYYVLKYDELLYNNIKSKESKIKEELNDLFRKKGITDRKIDYILVNSDYAQEYGYILTERNYSWKISPKNRWLFENICKKIKYISQNDHPILLKNPYDFTNFLYIKKIYPNAKFIFIHRNPLQVLSSLMRVWRFLLKNKNNYTALFSKKYNQIFENPLMLFIARIFYTYPFSPGLFTEIHSYSKATNYFLKNKNRLPKEDYILIKYEDLCVETNRVIKDILNFLNLKTDKDFSGFIKPRKINLIPEVNILRKYIFKKMKKYFNYFKYYI